MSLMANVSRPLIGLLVATVLFFGVWVVALRPSSSSTSANGSGQGLGSYQSAINKAKASAASQNRAAAATGNTVSSAASTHSAAKSRAKTATTPVAPRKPVTRAKPVTATKSNTASKAGVRSMNVVERALAEHKVLAILVYNPAGADDQAVKQELGTISSHHGRVVKVEIPVSQIVNYPVLTTQVQIDSLPTMVIIDSHQQAFTIAGYTTSFEIAARVDEALSVH